jgi:hypothetical protein
VTSRLALLAVTAAVLAGCGGHDKPSASTCQAYQRTSGLSVSATANSGSDADCRRLLKQAEDSAGGFWTQKDPSPGEARETKCRMHGHGGVVTVRQSRFGELGVGDETCTALQYLGFT